MTIDTTGNKAQNRRLTIITDDWLQEWNVKNERKSGLRKIGGKARV